MKKIIYILIIIFLFSGMVFCGEEEARAGWYDGSWTYRKAVTVQSSKVETTETSFPVLVSVTDPDLRSTGNGGHISQANGYDIIFTDDNGTSLLDFEIESWDSSTGKIQAWVETDISTTVDKVIYMYYGNASATDISDAEGVWDINFVMVQHMQEDPGPGGVGDIVDSTSNNNDGTAEISMTSDDLVMGKIGGSFYFDGGDDAVIVPDSASLSNLGDITMSAWVYLEQSLTGTVYDPIIAKSNYASQREYRIRQETCEDVMVWHESSDGEDPDTNETTIAESDTTRFIWHYIVGTYNNSTNVLDFYFNNIHKDTHAGDGGTYDGVANLGIGAYGDQTGWWFFGKIDEVRVSNTVRSTGWIETEYNNQNNPETFLAFGSEERDVYYLMASANYKIEKDSINFGGTDGSSSDSYLLNDTMGEIGTGSLESDTYQVDAGYRQMSETYISITSPTDVTMAPNIGGVSGGTGNGQTAWTVTTDSSGGYSLDIKASSAPAMQSGANSFADYTSVVSGTPDYTWSVAAADSEFGFTPEGNDIVSKFKDNGADACNTGSNDTSDQCWSNLSISYENIAGSFNPNHPNGTATTVKFRAESGSSHLQIEGSYQATVTVTAMAL